MIVSAGYNIAGPEVEAALLTHPLVADCGVAGASTSTATCALLVGTAATLRARAARNPSAATSRFGKAAGACSIHRA